MRFSAAYRWASVIAKLYCVAALFTVAIFALAISAFYFARTTQSAALHLYQDGFLGIEISTRLESLIELNRRIVQSSPAEVDRSRLEQTEHALDANDQDLKQLLKQLLQAREDQLLDDLEEHISRKLPELFQRGHKVLFYAYNFAQDKALDFAAKYSDIADSIQADIENYRQKRLEIAQSEVSHLTSTATSMIIWVSLLTIVILGVIGPFGILIVTSIITRLRAITRAMTRLAQNDTTVPIPSDNDADEVGDMARAVKIFKANAIELIQRKTELEKINIQFDAALNNMTQGLCMFDKSERLIVCNSPFRKMYALGPEIAKPGIRLCEILEYRIIVGNNSIENITEKEPFELCIEESAAISITQHLKDGRMIATSRQTLGDGSWVEVHEDVTERLSAEARISYLARHDALTDLPNRVLFREDLERAFVRMRRGEQFGLLCLDLDEFKEVNDTLGHPVGDQVLRAISTRLKALIRETDTVARLGGDEFAIVQTKIERPEDCSVLANKLLATLNRPLKIGGQQFNVGASIGIALAPNDGSDPDQLLKNADMAMYLAKKNGRGLFRFFEPDMDTKLQARRMLEIDLRRAVANGEFELHYQPLINIETGKISSFEALLRWRHPERGVISPNEFVSLAEDTGLIIPIGESVLRQACAAASTWPRDLKVSVNLSPIQFKTSKLVEVIINAIASARLPASRLEVEITESVLIQDDDTTLKIVNQLHDLGVQISLDDFGTGYSSLSYLRKFPFDKIKIDASFVHGLPHRKDNLTIVRAVVNIAKSFGITTVAEGVETVDQFKAVRAEGCTEAQGYHFSRPVPSSNVLDLLAQWDRRRIAA